MYVKSRGDMAFLEKARRIARFLPTWGKRCDSASRARPERIVLGARAGVAPSPKPPVRIFVGSEPAQYRAERVFFWSIEQVRDPGRVYEIYLMKELAGFDRRGWLTGFTNYRFAIPHFAGGSGRAIYNDVDQIYLADPGELFDTDLHSHGFLALSDRDTSVMLIDCARMASIWTLAAAQRERRKAMEERARQVPGTWGPFEALWHARDGEYQPGKSRLIHYTEIHAQPWRPFPRRYAYQRNPVAHVWFELERSADAAGYQVFTAERPSAQYQALPAQLRKVRVEVLEYLPDEDVPWVLDELFRGADQSVSAVVTATSVMTRRFDRAGARRYLRDRAWWLAHFAAASARHPAVHWRLVTHGKTVWGKTITHTHEGGKRLQGPPSVWVLTDDHPGNTTQSLGLAKALGWPCEIKQLFFTPLLYLHEVLFGAFGATRLGLNRSRSDALAPPWPDLVIAAGWRTEHIARWIQRQSHGQTRLVQLGRKGGRVADHFDLVVSCTYFRLPPHPRRVEISAPITQVTAEQLEKAAERWRDAFVQSSHPRMALLVGGDSSLHRLDVATARRLGEQVRDFARAVGGSVFATTSRRTGSEAAEALRQGIGDAHVVHLWRPEQPDNPYLAYLALADVIIVTGESESMLAEAVATGKPVYIYPLPKRQPNRWVQFKEWIVACSRRQCMNERGTARPQKWLEYVCARLIERGIILPQQDLHVLHETLVRRSNAHFFGEPLDMTNRPVVREIDEVAHRVRQLMGIVMH